MELSAKGSVSAIVYRNEENGYTVFDLQTADGEDMTCVGTFATLSVGVALNVHGKMTTHKIYGEQLAVDSYTVCDPTSEQGIIKYLGSGLIKGVGEVTARNIYAMFGNDTFGVIEHNPMLLAKVKGISQKKAMDIANAVSELTDNVFAKLRNNRQSCRQNLQYLQVRNQGTGACKPLPFDR